MRSLRRAIAALRRDPKKVAASEVNCLAPLAGRGELGQSHHSTRTIRSNAQDAVTRVVLQVTPR
jgi:hypothetical protein